MMLNTQRLSPYFLVVILGVAWQCCNAVQAANSVVQVVLPDAPIESVKYAAEELAYYLEKVTNATVNTVANSQWQTQKEVSTIVLGIVPNGDDAINTHDSYRLVSQGKTLYLYGYDQLGNVFISPASKGTLFAVYDYLQSAYGIDWICPGPIGEVVPEHHTSIVTEGFDKTESPDFEQRVLNVGVWLNHYRDVKDRLNISEADDELRDRRERQWTLRKRLSVVRFVEASHAFTEWWDRYHETNPEWFAQHRNGKRMLVGKKRAVKLCTSNPEVIDATVKAGLELIERNPLYVSISGSPNDSAFSNWCSCDACEALDHPEGVVARYSDADGWYEHVSMSDRMVAFWNAMAERLEKVRPDLKVAGYAYYSTSSPPLRENLHPNVLIGFVQQAASYWDKKTWESERAKFDGWADRGGKGYWRPNAILIGHGIATNFIPRLAEDIKHIHKRGTRYVFYDSMIPHWGTRGHMYYVLSHLLWDSNADAEQVFNTYLENAYGSASPHVRQYYERLTEVTDTMFESGAVDGGLWRASAEYAVAKFYTDDLLEALQNDLDQALAAATEKGERDRVELLRDGLEYNKLQIAVFRKLYLGDDSTKLTDPDVVEAIENRNNWLIEHPMSQAISAVAALRIGEITDKIALKLRDRLSLEHLRGE